MTNISKRLKALVKFVDKEDSLVDVGCDHGLLSIYLAENKLCKSIVASDINPNALNNAKENIKKRNLNIKTYLSDGIDDIPLEGINGLIISGMGSTTINHILANDYALHKHNINKLIIQSNNDWQMLRECMNITGYYLEDEEYTFDKGKWYITCYFIKSDKKNTKRELEFGYLKDKEYLNYLLDHYQKINKKIPLLSIKDKFKVLRKIRKIKAIINE